MNIYICCHFKFHDWSWVLLEHGLHQNFNFVLLVLHSCWERRHSTPPPTFNILSRYEWGVYGIRWVSLLCALSTPHTILGTTLDCIINFLIHLSTMNCKYYEFEYWKQSRVPLDQWLDQKFFFSPLLPNNNVKRDDPLKPFPSSQFEIKWMKNWWSNICGPIIGGHSRLGYYLWVSNG